jgi:hypothetical protein
MQFAKIFSTIRLEVFFAMPYLFYHDICQDAIFTIIKSGNFFTI